jgi:flagellar biosynthetic protein FliP
VTRAQVRRLALELGGMLAASLAGMLVLGGAFAGLLAAGGSSLAEAQREAPTLVLAVGALSMTLPMAAWMRRRRHPWSRVAEMSTAMLVPALALAVGVELGALEPGPGVFEAQHTAMVPSMVVAMALRCREYAPA